jgi:hypothetical protein
VRNEEGFGVINPVAVVLLALGVTAEAQQLMDEGFFVSLWGKDP